MYQYMFCYYYVSVLHLFGYSVNRHSSIRVRVKVWYYLYVVIGTCSNSPIYASPVSLLRRLILYHVCVWHHITVW